MDRLVERNPDAGPARFSFLVREVVRYTNGLIPVSGAPRLLRPRKIRLYSHLVETLTSGFPDSVDRKKRAARPGGRAVQPARRRPISCHKRASSARSAGAAWFDAGCSSNSSGVSWGGRYIEVLPVRTGGPRRPPRRLAMQESNPGRRFGPPAARTGPAGRGIERTTSTEPHGSNAKSHAASVRRPHRPGASAARFRAPIARHDEANRGGGTPSGRAGSPAAISKIHRNHHQSCVFLWLAAPYP